MLTEDTLLRFWGKSDRDNPANYHPLLFHLIDVGQVAKQLWDALPLLTRQFISRALGLDETQARQFCILLSAQHDLGKLAAFQFKASVPQLHGAIMQAGYAIPYPDEQPHGYVTAYCLPTVDAPVRGWDSDQRTKKKYTRIVGGHHGSFPTRADVQEVESTAAIGAPMWDEARAAMLVRLGAALFSAASVVALPPSDDGTLVPLVGGFVSVADWIGSSKTHFPPVGMMDVAAYAAISEAKAKQALADFGWTPRPQFAAPAQFSELFPGLTPNAMQRMAADFADQTTAPYLLIIEAAMGGGKTEGAIYATDRALTTGIASGSYFAMPTQATGNAMFDRVRKDYLRPREHSRRLGMQLVHGGSFLSEAFDTIKLNPIYSGIGDRDDSVVAHSWFTSSKEALLAPFGVGTIDQTLLGVLQTKHWFVRLFGLAGKVIVFDEIHSYDIYMSSLLQSLLGWLRELGCTVVLLSATLPTASRESLVAAWDPKANVPRADYPRITYVDGKHAQCLTIPTDHGAEKQIRVRYASASISPLARQLETELPERGCAAVICNTVARAQAAYQGLGDCLGADWKVWLYHARTIAKWRREREKDLHAVFGKNGDRSKYSKIVLVASPALQESLDLDFDWMATELAPIDLMLQRLGRLWRHLRDGRPMSQATLTVLSDTNADGLPDLSGGADVIYEAYLLLRSRLAFPDGDYTLPMDIDTLVRAVYDDTEPIGLSPVWLSELTDTRQTMDNKRQDDASTAVKNLVKHVSLGAGAILDHSVDGDDNKRELFDDDDPELHIALRAATRLGDPSITIICSGTSVEGEALAALSSGVPDIKTARELLDFSMPINHKKLYAALKDDVSPAQWRKSPYLRRCRCVNFENGEGKIGDRQVRLSRAKGLEIL